jgi:hypothetical protein
VIGQLADVSGQTLQVQGASGQVAVTYSGNTAITNTVQGSANDLKAEVCVAVQSKPQAQSGADTAPTPPSEVTATSVTISKPGSDGTCAGAGPGGGAGGGGPRGGGGPGGGPNGGQRPTRTPGGRPGGFGGMPTNGLVSSVASDTFVVKATNGRGADGQTSTTRNVTVTTNSATTWNTEVDADAKALVVGTCVTAMGTADDTGAIKATSIGVRPAAGGSCTPAGRPGQGAAAGAGQ